MFFSASALTGPPSWAVMRASWGLFLGMSLHFSLGEAALPSLEAGRLYRGPHQVVIFLPVEIKQKVQTGARKPTCPYQNRNSLTAIPT